MKHLILITTLVSQMSLAAVIEKNPYDSTIYYAPTPSLEVSVMDLGDDGAVMTLFIDYKSGEIEAEEKAIRKENFGYKTQVIGAMMAVNSIEFSIPSLNIREFVPVKQGQTGPYINYQFTLYPAQLAAFKRTPAILSEMKIEIPVTTQYYSQKLIEEIEVAPEECEKMTGASLKDMVIAMSDYRPKQSVQNTTTLNSLKKNMLTECFSINSPVATSFRELMDMHVHFSGRRTPIVGQTIAKRPSSVQFNITPKIKVVFPTGDSK